MVRNNYAVIGLQAGDEGKGKGVAYLVDRAVKDARTNKLERDSDNLGLKPVLVVRYQGGPNAGHTVVIRGTKYKLHQIPSGVLIDNTFNLVDEGMFFSPRAAVEEIETLRAQGVRIGPDNLGIASNAHVILDYHIEMDSADSKPTAKKSHTSTGRGIKPTAVDKYGRTGVRFAEFLNRDAFRNALLDRAAELKKQGIEREDVADIPAFIESYEAEREFFRDFAVLRTDVLKRHGTHSLIAESAQGFRLDVDKGLYPGVTSSNPVRIPSEFISNGTNVIYGVVKLYESSAGGGNRPFVGQMRGGLETVLRKAFKEQGTTTTRDRDLGWFDVVAVKHAFQDTGTHYLVSSCGDRLELLATMGEKVRIVVAYKIDGRTYDEWHPSFHNRETLRRAEPVFEDFEPWTRFVDDNGDLTPNAQIYIDAIQKYVGAKFIMHGAGEGIDDVVEMRNPLYPTDRAAIPV